MRKTCLAWCMIVTKSQFASTASFSVCRPCLGTPDWASWCEPSMHLFTESGASSISSCLATWKQRHHQ